MLIITVHVDAPLGQAIGVKEDLAMHLERFGNARVVSVVEKAPEQLRIEEGGAYDTKQMSRMRR